MYKTLLVGMLGLSSLLAGAAGSNFLVMSLQKRAEDIFSPAAFLHSIQTDQRHLLMFLVLSLCILLLLCYMAFWKRRISPVKVKTREVIPGVEIPIAAGQNQHGSARFATPVEQEKMFRTICLPANSPLIRTLLKEGRIDYESVKNGEIRKIETVKASPLKLTPGIPVGYERDGDTEIIRVISGDLHIICFGTTRCGKTRTLVLQSICIQGLAGVDIVSSDPKGELFQYTSPFLKRLGYRLYPIDFKNPRRSVHYNFLQFVVDAVNQDDISKAISACWDFVDSMVQEGKATEPLWTNGEKGLLAAAVMMVVYDNSPAGLRVQYPDASDEERAELYQEKHRWYQNCINLYYFLARLGDQNPRTENLLLEDIISVLPEHHPARLTLAIAQSAPSKTRGSFVTSALATLRLFTDPNIADMTGYTDDGLLDLKTRKAIFLILPDNKQTYYPLASLFVNQYYQYLADEADERGGRLERDVKFNLDEFGNFTKIPFFDGKLTVAAGRGIHFYLYLQSKEQLTEKYGKEVSEIILDNCLNWIYLKSGPPTAKIIEERMGKYTVETASASASLNDNGGLNLSLLSGSTSTSTQLIGRPLLTSDEIQKLERPDLLVLRDNGLPCITQCPDMSQWRFNEMLGMGDKDFNTLLRDLREKARPAQEIEKFRLWDFLPYINRLVEEKKEELQNQKEAREDFLEAIAQNFSEEI